MKNKVQSALAAEMLTFLEETPLTKDLQWTKDLDFLYHFEAERQLIVRDLLDKAGVRPQSPIKVLDFGFLHGLTQEFFYRAFPQSKITVCDLPSSPIFESKTYLEAIGKRDYLRLVPLNLDDVTTLPEKYDVIILGEVIEHLDPTQVARAFVNLRKVASPKCVFIITTPNGAGFYNSWMMLQQKNVIQSPPIPDKTFGYGHIHLWSLNILKLTADHYGWTFLDARFYHGREGEMFEEVKAAWGSLGTQIKVRLLKFIAERTPKWRGFYVAAFTVKNP